MAEREFNIWNYAPSIPAAIVFILLFGGSTGFHCWQAYRKRSLFMIPFIIGGFFELFGYVGRILAHSNQTSVSIFIFQTILLLVGPTLLSATIYMTLGRIIAHTRGEHLTPIRRTWLTKIFVISDVVTFFIQAGGGALMAKARTQDSGKVIVLGGLGIQIVIFGIFIGSSALFHKRLSRTPTPVSTNTPWKEYMYSFYLASALITIRIVFRIAEFQGGHNGELMKKEVYIYIFDAVLMFGVMAFFNVVHPGNLIGARKLYEDSVPLSS